MILISWVVRIGTIKMIIARSDKNCNPPNRSNGIVS